MELETQKQYAHLVAEMMTFSTLAVQDPTNSNLLDSLMAELTGAQKRMKDTVY